MNFKSMINKLEFKTLWKLLLIPLVVFFIIASFNGLNITTILTTAVALVGMIISWWLLLLKKDELLQGIWTSLGILGTFIALVFAFKDKSLFMNKNGELQLDNLLPYLSSAFITSVVGISMGVFFSIRNKYYESEREETEKHLQDPPEKMLFDMKEAIIKISLNISQDLSKQMVPFFENLNNAVFKNMQPVLNQSNETLKELNKKIEVQFSGNIKKFNSVTEKMDDIMTQQTENTKVYAKTISTTLNELVNKLSQSLDNVFKENINELDRTFENLKNWQVTSKEALSAITENLESSVSQYQSFNSKQEDVLENIEKQLISIDEIRKTKGNEIQVVEIYDEKLTDLINRINDLNKVINQMDDIKNIINHNPLIQFAKTPTNGHSNTNENEPLTLIENVQ